MKITGILILLFGAYFCHSAQTNTIPNNRFGFKPIDPQLNIDIPYIQFHKDNRVSPCLQNNLDWKFKNENALRRNNLCEIRSLQKSDEPISFSGSMPVYNPQILSKLPVLYPDSSTHYHMLIKKMIPLKLHETALR